MVVALEHYGSMDLGLGVSGGVSQLIILLLSTGNGTDFCDNTIANEIKQHSLLQLGIFSCGYMFIFTCIYKCYDM